MGKILHSGSSNFLNLSERRNSGRSEFYDFVQTPVGTLYLVFFGVYLASIEFRLPREIPFKKNHNSLIVKKELTEYFEKGRREFNCKTQFIKGTEFEKKVWNALSEIPYGQTKTYKWIAERAGSPGGSRAAGQALGKNPIPIIFPCHRVIESDGSLGGYSSGSAIKRRLLEIEYYQSRQIP
jgi:methylated-DNA-[protein]-cysteine S-methyltransferase